MRRLAVYVDGFNLYHGIHDWSKRRDLWLDLEALARDLRPRDDLVAIKYFTADVLNDSAGLSRQTMYQRALRANTPILEIVQGRYQGKKRTCLKCGHQYTHYEEKETDVNIASALISDAAVGLSDTSMIISADSDLVPAAEAATRINPNLFVLFAFPPNRHSQEITSKYTATFTIGKQKIRKSQLPDPVIDQQAQRSISRPAEWA